VLRGWALAEQGQSDAGILQMREGMAACRTTGAEADRPYFLVLVAETYGREGRYDEGLAMLEEALALVDQSEERYWEAEIHRLNGELLLARSAENQVGSLVISGVHNYLIFGTVHEAAKVVDS